MTRGPTARRSLTWRLVVVLASMLSACNQPQQVSSSGYGAYEVSLASWGESALALVWYDTRDGNAEIYARFIEGTGRPIGVDYRLTHTSDESFEPDVVALEDGVAIAWYEKSPAEALRAQLGAWDLALEPKWNIALGDAGSMTRNPVLRATADGLFAAWIERTSPDVEVIRAARFGFDGTPSEPPVTLGPASETTWNLNAAIDPQGNPIVAYDARSGTQADELYLAIVLPSGVSLTRVTPDDGRDSKYPDIAFAESGSAALTWFDTRDGNEEVYLAIGSLEDLLADIVTHATRVTETPGQSIGAYVAWNGARVGLTWSDDSEGEHEIYFQSFDDDGAAVPPRRITTNPTSSLIPAIKPWRDGFELAWIELTAGAQGPHDADTRSEVSASFVQ